MDAECPYCKVTLAPNLFHDHYEKCRKVTNAIQQQPPYQSPSPNEYKWPSQIPALSESSPTNPLSSGQFWKCNCCNLNYANKKEFQEHLASAEHKVALNLTTNGGSGGYQNSGQLSNELMSILTMRQPGVDFHSPPTQPQVNEGAPQRQQSNEEEIRSIVRSEMTRYLKHLLLTIENDTGKNPV
nr:expressed protein [Hymenolepis microstoma]